MSGNQNSGLSHYDLEGEIHDAVNMAELTTDVIEELFRGRAGDSNMYEISEDQMRQASFAVYHTADLARAVLKRWREVHASHGGGQ